jgi:Ca2+-binding RTX toxin-like protein
MLGTVEGTSGAETIADDFQLDPEGEATTPGNDRVEARDGDDLVFARDGDDVVLGEGGDDTLFGQGGDDLLDGGEGNDLFKGGDGDDHLIGGPGRDSLFGGADRDVLVLDQDDAIADGGDDGDDLDVLDLRGLPPYRIDNLRPDWNGTGYSGTVVFLDPDGNPTGESVEFVDIEEFLTDPPGPRLDGTVEGTAGDDLIDIAYTGDPEGDRVDNNDAILPGQVGDDDLIYAFGGNDTVLAGNGNDQIFGGAGNDELHGEDGNDTIFGNLGDDTVHGGAGDDSIQDSQGADVIFGGDGHDIIRLSEGGDAAGDSVLGGMGRDTIFGGIGDDVIDASDGGVGVFDNPYPPLPADPYLFDDRDVVFGGDGDDRIRTGDDDDTIDGGDGHDHIDAGIDDDLVFGGNGDDTIVGGEGNDSIEGGDGDDLIYGGLDPRFPDSINIPDDGSAGFPDLVTDNGRDRIDGGQGDDTIYGLDDDDTIFGGQGNDWIDAGVDDDEVFGGAGNDTIIGGQGVDRLFGGDDRDLFLRGNTGDHADGGSGGDDFDTLDLTRSGVDFLTFTSPDREDGFVTFNDGSTMTFEEMERVIPCFTPGTLIATPRGERPVEELRAGDRIITRDNGIQEIRWVGRKEMSGRALVGSPHLRPILIKAGSLGRGLPERDMMVSPNHRILVANDRTHLYFEESEVLASAKHLTGLPGVYAVEAVSVTYIHFMFDRHEVVLSNGAWTESFQPGDWSLKGVGNAQRNELFELFPELRTPAGIESYQAARRSLKKHEARLLVE